MRHLEFCFKPVCACGSALVALLFPKRIDQLDQSRSRTCQMCCTHSLNHMQTQLKESFFVLRLCNLVVGVGAKSKEEESGRVVTGTHADVSRRTRNRQKTQPRHRSSCCQENKQRTHTPRVMQRAGGQAEKMGLRSEGERVLVQGYAWAKLGERKMEGESQRRITKGVGWEKKTLSRSELSHSTPVRGRRAHRVEVPAAAAAATKRV